MTMTMIQLYARLLNLTRTEEEYMPNRSDDVNALSARLMAKYRTQIPVNGITDQLKVNPDGTLSDGNARHIIALEQIHKLIDYNYGNRNMFWANKWAYWNYMPVNLGWLLGIQYFPNIGKITIRSNLLPYFTVELDSKRPIELPLKPVEIDNPDLPIKGFSDITAFHINKRYWVDK